MIAQNAMYKKRHSSNSYKKRTICMRKINIHLQYVSSTNVQKLYKKSTVFVKLKMLYLELIRKGYSYVTKKALANFCSTHKEP